MFYIDNVIQNENIEYYSTGEIKSITQFKDGKEVGEAFEFSLNGDVISELVYNDGYLKSKIEINRLDEDGKKTGYWREFYENGQLKSESNYEKGIKKGISKEYTEKGKLSKVKRFYLDSLSQAGENVELIKLYKEFYPGTYKPKLVGGFSNGMKQGMYREYTKEGKMINGYIYKNDTIIARGLILNDGTYDGDWEFIYSSGQVKSTGIYEKGSKNGMWTYYYFDGKLQQKGKYKNEIPSGEWKWYFPNGTLKRVEYYRKGKLEGSQIEYNQQGSEIANGEFYMGLKEGPWFYHVGDHKEVGEFTMGYKTNNWKYYYKNGKLAFQGLFDEGQPKGKHIYYYPTGGKKLSGKYQAGKKIGTWKSYNENGEIIEVLRYKRGKLITINGQKIIEIKE